MDDVELDNEDLAVLAEVKKKGYYHGRLHNADTAASYAPKKIESAEELAAVQNTSPQRCKPVSRREVDPFQAKWDKWDKDDFVDEAETKTTSRAAPRARRASADAKSSQYPQEVEGLWGWLKAGLAFLTCRKRAVGVGVLLLAAVLGSR
uniref:Uncharacterized protein n=2 Tax=Oxyrrhis marina TaxID=2969 RepID=A0A6U9LCE4_OXYMA